MSNGNKNLAKHALKIYLASMKKGSAPFSHFLPSWSNVGDAVSLSDVDGMRVAATGLVDVVGFGKKIDGYADRVATNRHLSWSAPAVNVADMISTQVFSALLSSDGDFNHDLLRATAEATRKSLAHKCLFVAIKNAIFEDRGVWDTKNPAWLAEVANVFVATFSGDRHFMDSFVNMLEEALQGPDFFDEMQRADLRQKIETIKLGRDKPLSDKNPASPEAGAKKFGFAGLLRHHKKEKASSGAKWYVGDGDAPYERERSGGPVPIRSSSQEENTTASFRGSRGSAVKKSDSDPCLARGSGVTDGDFVEPPQMRKHGDRWQDKEMASRRRAMVGDLSIGGGKM